MKQRRLPLLPLLALGVFACERDPENSPTCGLVFIAAASIVLQSLENLNQVVAAPPSPLPNVLPARVVGHGTARALVGEGPEGLVIGYDGPGFPILPGFGLLLVDDSSEAPRGVLIYEPEGPGGYPQLGDITGPTGTLPLYGLRVHWPSVNTRRCPLFAFAPGTAESAAGRE